MRTVLYTGIHQKNNGIIAWEYNWGCEISP